MANFIEKTNLPANSFTTPFSRYISSDVLYYGDNKLLTYETYKRSKPQFSDRDKFTIITKGFEYRPDLLSFKVYGFVDLWWKILEINNMKDIFEFKAGKNVRLPNNIFT